MMDKVGISQQQTQIDLALKMARMAFWEFDFAEKSYVLNDQAYAVLRTSAAEQNGYDIAADEFANRFIHPDYIPVMNEAVRDVLHASDRDFTSEQEYRVVFGDGQPGYLNVMFRAEWNGNGRVTRLYGTVQDITRRRQAEEELTLNKIQFKTLFDTASDDIELLDPQANIIDCNETHARLLGYGRNELIGRNATEFFTEDTIQRFQEKFPTLVEKGYVKCEMGMRHKDGSIIRVWRQAQAVQDDDGQLKGILIHNRDIMDPYMIEEQIELQNVALKASASAIVITDTYGIIQWVNPAFAALTGYTAQEVIGQKPNILKSTVHDDAFYANLWQTLKQGEIWQGEIVNRKKDGTFYTEEMTITPVRAHGDEITNYIAIKQDITERKEVEDAITKQAVEMKTVAEVSTAAATISDTGQLLQTVVDLAKARFELYHAHIYLFNDQKDELVLTVGAGDVGRQMVAQKHRIPLKQEKSLVAQAARTQKGVIENDVLRNPAFLPNPLLPETRSEMAVPMMIGDQVVGVLDVQAKRVGRFTAQDITVKTALAAQIAVALENARSYEQARTSLAETEALLEITKETSRVLDLEVIMAGVLDKVLETTGFDAGLITVINPKTKSLEIVSHRLPEPFLHMLEKNGLDGTLCDLVYRRQENVVVVDMADKAPVNVTGLLSMGYQSYQGVPLESKGEVLGTLCLFSQYPLTSETANSVFLQAVGQQVGIAIQNSALFNQTQEALLEAQQARQSTQEFVDMQRVLHELNSELFQIDDLDELYRRAVELAHTRLGFERIGMFLLNEAKDTLQGTYGVDTVGNIRSEQSSEHVITDTGTIDTFILNRTRLTVTEDSDLLQEGEVVGHGWHIGAAMWVEESPIGVIFADNLVTGQPLKQYQPELLFAYAGIVANLIKRHRVEETIRERETLMHTIIDSTPDWIFVKDRDHRYMLVNQGYADSMNMAPEEFIGKNDLDIGFPEEIVKGDPEKGIRGFWADDDEIMASGERKVIDEEPAVIDGEPRVLHTVKAPLRNADGEVTALVGFVHDITNLKATEETLAKRAEELQTVAEVATNAASEIDEDVLLQNVVDLTKERFGLYHVHIYLIDDAGENLVLTAGAGDVGQQMVADGHSIPLDREQSLVARAARTRQGVIVNDVQADPGFLPNPLLPDTRAEMAVPMIVANNVLGILDVQADSVNRFTNQDVQIQTTLAVQTAVALENVRLLNEVQENEQRYRTILDNANEIVFTLTPDGKFTYLSPAWTDLLGYSIEEGEGHPFTEFLHPDDIPTAFTFMEEIAVTGKSEHGIVYRQRHKNGDWRWYTTNGSAVKDENGNILYFIGLAQDITEQRVAEAVLRRSEAELSQALEIAKLGYWEYDVAKDLFTFNDQFYAIYHTTAEQHGGYHLSSAYYAEHFVYPDDVPMVGSEIERALTSTDRQYTRMLEHRILYADGSIGYISVSVNLERDEQGNIVRFYGANQDITERKLIEQAVTKQANELADLTRRLTREGWQDYLNYVTPENIGYIYDHGQVDSVELSISDEPHLWAETSNDSQPAKPLIQPISIHGEMIGRLAILPEEDEETFDAEMVEIIRSVTEQLQARIENLRLTDQTQMALAETEEQAQRLRRLNEMSTVLNQVTSLTDIYGIAVTEAPKVIPADRASLLLLDASGEFFEVAAVWGEDAGLPAGSRLKASGSPLYKAMQERRIWRDSAGDTLKDALYVPLIVSGQAVGVLNLGRYQVDSFNNQDEVLLRQVMAMLSSTIENIRFLENERARAQREQMLRQITQRIRSSADVETIMRTTVQEIGRTLGRKTYIYLGDENHEA